MESRTNKTEQLKTAGGYAALVAILASLSVCDSQAKKQQLIDRLLAESNNGHVILQANGLGETRQFRIAPNQTEIPEEMKSLIARAVDVNAPLHLTFMASKKPLCHGTLLGADLAALEQQGSLRRALLAANLTNDCKPHTTSAAPSAEAFAAYHAPAQPHPVVRDGQRVDTLVPTAPIQQL